MVSSPRAIEMGRVGGLGVLIAVGGLRVNLVIIASAMARWASAPAFYY